MSETCPATSGVVARPRSRGLNSCTVVRSERRTALISCGSMTTPSFAMPAATMAICSAVACTSRWPIEDCASAASSMW